MILANRYYVHIIDSWEAPVGPKNFKEASKLREDYQCMGVCAKILMEVVDEEGNLVNEQSQTAVL